MASGGSSKEIKQLLKNAREAITSKEYKEVLKHCKAVLKQDKTNYNALVFVGVAAAELDQPDQAVAAYRKAIQTDQQQLLAWQGLAGFYEKSGNPDHRPELAGVYSQLRELFQSKDPKKWQVVSEKLARLQNELGDTEQAVQVLKSLVQSEESEDAPASLRHWIQIADALAKVPALSEEYITLLERAYKIILESGEDRQQHFGNYIKFLTKCNDVSGDRVQTECLRMHELFPSDPYPLTILAGIYLKCKPECLDEVAESVYTKLHSLDETSSSAFLGIGQINLARKNYLLARDKLQEGLKGSRHNVHGWLYLAMAQLGLHDNQAAVESSKEGLKILTVSKQLAASQLKRALLTVQADALLDAGTQSQAKKALQIYEKLLEQTDDAHRLSITCGICASHLILENREKAEESYQEAVLQDPNNDKVMALQGQIMFSHQQLDKAEQRFLEALGVAPDCGLYHLWLGKVYWVMGRETRADKSKMLASLLKAAKLDPYYSDTFLYLGHFYWQVAGDKSKGRKCYQKAYELNPQNEEAAAALGDACIELGEEDAALQLYRNVTEAAAAGTAKWAWLRLGLYYHKQANHNDAVASFQAALRADPKDRHCWECLGDAYMSRGSYTAALKAFTRGVELDSSAKYCLFQIAAIKQTLEAYTEAASEYQIILDSDPDYIPALKGQGETYVRLARSSLNQYFNGRAVDYVKLAIQVLARAASLRPDLSCVWKLLGDACTVLHPLSDKLISVPVPANLMDHSFHGETSQNKKQLLSVGARCYGRALHLQSGCAALWQDLGTNYYYQSLNDTTNSTQLADRALQCLKKALVLDSTNHGCWTALGVIAASRAMDNPALAQHAFIKSIQLEANNVVAWTNLGALYLSKGNVELAHQAFKISQSLEPSYVNCWIGQALVAESSVPEEAMDLFRHTTELATHSEGAVSYAHWVCQTLLDASVDKTSERYRYNIVQMDAVSMATVGLDKVTDRVQTDACAYTMYGLLLERQGLHKSAEKAYARVLELMNDSNDQERLNLAMANHARSLCSIGRHEEAVKQFQAITPLIRLQDICCLALALYKTGNMQASYQAYEQALQLASDGGVRSQLLACLGMVAFQCGDNNRAKTLLFQSSQESEPAPEGLLALLALGVHQDDYTLATAAVAELQKLKDKPGIVADVAFAGAVLYAIQGQFQLACRQVAKATGRHPGLPELWRLMAEIILQLLPAKAKATVTCSRAALQDKEVSKASVSTYALATLAVGQHGGSTPAHQRCLSAAQKAVHLYPDSMENWASLSASYLSHGIWNSTQKNRRDDADNNLASKLATFVQSWAERCGHAAIHQWAGLQVVVSLMHEGRLQRADALTRKLEVMYQSEPHIKSALQLLQAQAVCMQHVSSQSVELLRTVISRTTHQTSAAWQLLAKLYEQESMAAAAESAYKQSLVHSQGQQLVPLLRLAHLALRAAKASSEDRWSSLVLEATGEALKIQPTCTVALLLQGLLQQHKGNARQAKRCFQQVLEMSTGKKMNLGRSVARYHMMQHYLGKKNTKVIQVLIEEAVQEHDPNLQLLQELVPSA